MTFRNSILKQQALSQLLPDLPLVAYEPLPRISSRDRSVVTPRTRLVAAGFGDPLLDLGLLGPGRMCGRRGRQSGVGKGQNRSEQLNPVDRSRGHGLRRRHTHSWGEGASCAASVAKFPVIGRLLYYVAWFT